jgi:hypothetical protein
MPDVRSRGRTYGRAANEPKPRSDAYTGLLLLSLLAQVAGAVFLFLDWHQYPDASPPEVKTVAVAPAANPTPPGQPPAGPAPLGQPPGGPQPPVNPAANPGK